MIKQLIKKIESVLGHFSITWVNQFIYTLYEDLLLLSSCSEDDDTDDLYRDINYTLYKYFNNADKKYLLEDKEEYCPIERLYILRHATNRVNQVCVSYGHTGVSS